MKNAFHLRKNRFLFALTVFLSLIFSFSSARAAVEISGIPAYAQRNGFTIPLDVNPRGVWFSTLSTDGQYIDCGMACLSMLEAYFAGYSGQENYEYVYYRVFAARNPNAPWASLDHGQDITVSAAPGGISGYATLSYLSPEQILAQLNAGNPVMVWRNISSSDHSKDHWVIIYGYDGPSDYVNWGSFKIMSPTYDDGVHYTYLSNFVWDYSLLRSFMYRTTGILPNKKTPVDLGDSLQTKIYLVQDNKAIAATDAGNIELASDRDVAGQDWLLEKTIYGSYIITSLRDGRVMDLANGSTLNGTNIGLCPRHADTDPSLKYQRWYIYDNGDGYYRLSPEVMPQRSLDATGGSTADGTNIQLYDSNDTIAQRLKFAPFGGEILQGITCSKTNITLRQGASEQLTVSYIPWQAVPLNRRGIIWSSSAPTVASVNSDGLVTALSEGSCTITATSSYNNLLSSACTVTVETGIQIPEISSLTVDRQTVHLSWRTSPAVDENDDRAYDVFVYPKGNTDNCVWSALNITASACDILLSEHGEYTVHVRAVNRTNGSCSQFSSRAFTVLNSEWLYFDELPENLPDGEIQYLNRYTDREQADSPGEGWTRGQSKITYVNGNVLYSEEPYPLQESDTLVPLGTFYYHYCDGSNTVEHYWTERFCNVTRMDNNGQFDIVWQGTDDIDPRFTVYRLRWNIGQWAGGLATCSYGYSDAMALYYLGYRYQERTAVTTYVWSKESAWSDKPDPDADSVSYRVRDMSCENRLIIPTGTVRIEREAFLNNTAIQEVIVPDGCEYIGSRAFAGCTELKCIYIPHSTVVESDAFVGCAQVQIIRTEE